MQARLQEIRDRLKFATNGDWMVVEKGNSIKSLAIVAVSCDNMPQTNICSGMSFKNIANVDFISNSPADIQFLMDALEQSQDRERVLREALDKSKQIALNCVSKVRCGLGAGGHGSGMITEVEVGGVVLDCVQDCIDETFDETLKEDKP